MFRDIGSALWEIIRPAALIVIAFVTTAIVCEALIKGWVKFWARPLPSPRFAMSELKSDSVVRATTAMSLDSAANSVGVRGVVAIFFEWLEGRWPDGKIELKVFGFWPVSISIATLRKAIDWALSKTSL